jgi:hypothetical protein
MSLFFVLSVICLHFASYSLFCLASSLSSLICIFYLVLTCHLYTVLPTPAYASRGYHRQFILTTERVYPCLITSFKSVNLRAMKG